MSPRLVGPDYPQVCIDWCDAFAYCIAVGKRLCGNRVGGPAAYASYADPSFDQWSYACTSAGINAYTYGPTFDAAACNVEGTYDSAGMDPSCQSSVPGFGGVFDLSGNVAEWEDSCDSYEGEWDTCRNRGGGTYGIIPDETTACDAGGAGGFRGDRMSVVGFRCCWP